MTNFPIYVVDDDIAIRQSLSFMLRTSGFDVRTFEDGASFLAKVRNLDPGVVLLDLRMPRQTGAEVQIALQEMGIKFPVIVMTGHGDIKAAVTAMKSGAIEFIEKPFEKKVMIAAIEQSLEELQNRKEGELSRQEARGRISCLSAREMDVLKGLTEGYPNKTIGYDLGISPRTVEIHRANLMRKLDASSLSELLRVAFHAGVGEA